MKIYNSVQEVGSRILLILSAIKTSSSLMKLVYYDYFSTHIKDLYNELGSLHPDNPNHSSEIIVKKELVGKAISFLLQKGLITVKFNENGIEYNLTSYAKEIIELLQKADYSQKYMKCILIVDNKLKSLSDEELNKFVFSNISSWRGRLEK